MASKLAQPIERGILCTLPPAGEPHLLVERASGSLLIGIDGRARSLGTRAPTRHRSIDKSLFFVERGSCALCGEPLAHAGTMGSVQQLFFSVALVRCRCGLVQKREFPRTEVLSSIYGESYANFSPPDPGVVRRVHGPRLARLPRGRGRLLDVGCGAGGFVLAAQLAGYDAQGLDPFLPQVDARSVSGLHRMSLDAAAQSLDLGRFDVVTLWAVWEHLEDPLSVLGTAQRLLVPGGSLVLNSPSGASVHARLRPDRWYMATLLEHLHFLTPEAARSVSSRLDLRLTALRSAGVPFPLGGRGTGSIGQGLNAAALRRILDLKEPPAAASRGGFGAGAVLPESDPGRGAAACAPKPAGRSLTATLREQPILGRAFRSVLAASRLGDHLEITLTQGA